MCRVETLMVLPMAALCLPVVTRRIRPNDFMPYPVCIQMFLEKGRLIPVSGKTVREFRAIIRLDVLNRQRKSFYEILHKLRGRISAVFLKGFHETPPGILINGRVLEEAFSNDLTVFEAGGGNEFHIHLNTLPRIVHLLIWLGNILWVWRMYSPIIPCLLRKR